MLALKCLGLLEVLFSTRLKLFDQKYCKNSIIIKKKNVTTESSCFLS